MLFKDRTVLVTGASRGIGLAIAQAFAQQGAFVIGTATSIEGAKKFEEFLLSNQFSGIGLVLNLANDNSINLFFEELKKTNKIIDILINNAGITKDMISLRLKLEDWNDVILTNLTGTFRITQHVLKNMLRLPHARIINISSIVASIGNPGQVNYCASKAGLIGMMKSLALEVASRGITINTISPGFIETDMTSKLPEDQREKLKNMIPSQKLGQPEDIAHACLFLASPQASYITGQTLHVNGGMHMN